MLQTLKDILINIFASAIWVIIGIAITTIYYYVVEKLPARRIWGLNPNKNTEVYLTVTNLAPQKAAEYNRPTTGIGELEAVSYVRESLVSSYPTLSANIHIVFSNRFPETGLNGNIISIGGTKHNEITRLFAKGIDTPLDFIHGEKTVAVDKIENKNFYPDLHNPNIIIDYGIITRISNPFNSNKAVLLLRGAHTYGVAGCGRILTAPYISHLSKTIQKLNSKNWQALILVRCVGLQVFPEIIIARPIKQMATKTDKG